MREFLKGFYYAFSGIKMCVQTERNFRVHMVAAVTVLIFALIYGVSAMQGAILSLTIFLVFAMEGVNTAVEATIDLVSHEKSKLAKTAKDTAAGAVLLAAISSVIVALFIFSDTARLAAAFGTLLCYWWAVLIYVVMAVLFVFMIKDKKNKEK